MTPKRIQRKRTKGWKMPPGTEYVGRPTRFGNPYKVGDNDPMMIGNSMKAADTVRMYRWYLEAHPEIVELARILLRGRDLACWCEIGSPCHGDVLLEMANK
jgi:hypothetical protein